MATNNDQPKQKPSNSNNGKPAFENHKEKTGTFDSIRESNNVSHKVPFPSTATKPPNRK